MKILLASGLVILSFLAINAQTNSSQAGKQVKINGTALELVSVTSGAKQCKDNKGVTVRLRVIGNSAVDVIRYLRSKNLWVQNQFMNQAVGSEINDFYCSEKAVFNYHTRQAGSSEAFPKPSSEDQ